MSYGIFEGDGRNKVQPTFEFPGTRGIAIGKATAREMIDRFLSSGHSTHSGAGGTLWVLLEYCQAARIAYRLRAAPGAGYYVEVNKEDQELTDSARR